MKAVVVFVLLGFAGVLASEQIWMELMSAQIVNAVEKDVAADRNIPELAKDLKLTTLVDYVVKANLADALSGKGPLTVFGPTNEAFEKLPDAFRNFLLKNITVLGDILKYHVASGNVSSTDLKNDLLIPSLLGSDIRINIYKDNTVITASGRPVTLPNQEASNGVIHEVSGVLFPPSGTITSVVSKCPAFSTLLTAVSKIPAIVTTLNGPGPFTLFAPSDKAFAKIPKKCLEKLLENTELLTKVLEYHVVPSTAYSAGLSCGDEVKTVQGGLIKVSIWKGRIFINHHSEVTYADGTATNGVIHVIDRVLFPKEAENFCDESYHWDNDVNTAKDNKAFKPFFIN